MEIGIIGSGHIGGTLTRRFRAVGHEVAVANSRPCLSDGTSAGDRRRRRLVERSRSKQGYCGDRGAYEPRPGPSERPLRRSKGGAGRHRCGQLLPAARDGRIACIEDSSTESGWVQQKLGRPVVKAFNTIIAKHLLEGGKPAGAAGRIALAVAGDDPTAKALAMRLIDQIGFDAVDAGSIEESWRQQPGSPGYLKDFDIPHVKQALAEAIPERGPEWRATAKSPGTYDAPA